MEIREICPSLGHTIARTIVSVRYDEPGRLSEPIRRKLMVSLSVRGGKAAGLTSCDSAMGGAATVGKSWLKSTVAVMSGGWVGMGDGVSVGRSKACSDVLPSNDNSDGCVGV
jgi:hypothetical protein